MNYFRPVSPTRFHLLLAVRKKARELVELLQDTKKIREEREKARKLMQRILGGSVGSGHGKFL